MAADVVRSDRPAASGAGMRIAYVDEAYDSYRYRLVAVMLEPAQVNPFSQSLDELTDRLLADFGIEAPEFHGYEVFQGKGAWKGQPPRVRIWAYQAVLERLRAAKATVAVVGVDMVQAVRWGTPQYLLQMALLALRLHLHAEELGGYVLMVADEHASEALCRAMVRWMQQGKFQGAHLRVIDSLHYVRSNESRPVQGADFVAFLLRRAVAERDPRKRRVNASLLALVEPLVVVSHILGPRG